MDVPDLAWSPSRGLVHLVGGRAWLVTGTTKVELAEVPGDARPLDARDLPAAGGPVQSTANIWRPTDRDMPTHPRYREALRRALLQRIADRLAYARGLADGTLTDRGACCWVSFEWSREEGAGVQRWTRRICGDRCPHWHHETEVFWAIEPTARG